MMKSMKGRIKIESIKQETEKHLASKSKNKERENVYHEKH